MSITMLTCSIQVVCKDKDCHYTQVLEVEVDELDEGCVVHCPKCHAMSVMYLNDNPDRTIEHYRVDKEENR